MTLKNIANTNLTLSINEIGTTATLTITTAPDSKSTAAGAYIYTGDLGVTITSATNGVCTQTAPANATIATTAAKSKSGGIAVVREDDTAATVTITGVSGGGAGCTFPLTVYVSDAGQSKVKTK